MANQWLTRAIMLMTGGGETREQASERLAKAEAESAAGHRLLREYSANARKGREAEATTEAAQGVASTQSRAAAILEGNRVAKVQARKAPAKPKAKKAKKSPSPSFR